MQLSEQDKKLLANYVSNFDKDVYVLKNLPGEAISAIFAYVSRSPKSFRENLLELLKSGELEKRAEQFHRKYVLGFGHLSVVEHAVLNIAIENVSILLSKIIEDNRLASYTEKSTRYQIFSRDRYYRPKKIMQSRYARDYEHAMNHLFDFYTENFPQAIAYMREKFSDKPEPYVKSKACDVMRYALPASTLTNIGATFNARSLMHAISKLLSSPLEEAQALGKQLKEEASKFLPTLMKNVQASKYLQQAEKALAMHATDLDGETIEESNNVKLIRYEKDAEDKLLAALLYKHTHASFNELFERVKALPVSKKKAILEDAFKELTSEAPLRELEHINYTFEITLDFGAYRDLQRHRICTQTAQLLSTKHGFAMPEELKDIGLADKFCDAMKHAKEVYEAIASEMPIEAQYAVPLAFRRRYLLTANLRELFHIIRLRTCKAGHASYRRIAQQLYFAIKEVHPLIASFLVVNLE